MAGATALTPEGSQAWALIIRRMNAAQGWPAVLCHSVQEADDPREPARRIGAE